MKSNKVRFNLSRGKNYMKWKVMYNDGSVEFYHPTEVQIIMTGCTLLNNRKSADKIFSGETTKVVCAFIRCENVEVIKREIEIKRELINQNCEVSPTAIEMYNKAVKNE